MDREFLDLYNRELQLLYEQAREFAEQFPGIAERLGDLVAERTDPMIAGLLEGTAFLAARVQLKLKHEFPEFTNNLLEQLIPNYLAPTPSAMLAKALPPYSDTKLREGYAIPRGSYLDATYRERERQIACRYRLSSGLVLWPYDITAAEYYTTPGPLQALGLSVGHDVLAGMRLSLTHRTAVRIEDEMPDAESRKKPDSWFAGCRTTDLPIYLLGTESDAIALYEQAISDCVGVYFRYLDDFGDPVFVPAPKNCLVQVGFDEEDALFPNDNRIFRGFDFLREYFMFPRKFLAFRLVGLASAMPKLKAKSVDILFAFNKVTARLAAAVQPAMFALYAAPHYAGAQDKVPVRPLYSASMDRSAGTAEHNSFYTVRRLPRRRTVEERRYGRSSDYTRTDMFLSFVEPAELDGKGATELSLRTLCSNRHLTEQLPVGEGGADFRLLDDVTLDIVCIAGPTPQREPVVSQLRSRSETTSLGTVTWRLLNMLSMNHLGLVARGSGKNAAALREVLSMFGDLADNVTERKIRGIRGVDSRAVIRRVRERTGIGAGRGIEITATLDEKAFEGSGAFLLGAILDRFFAEYSALNHFTETVICTTERGEIMRWPTRMGARRPL